MFQITYGVSSVVAEVQNRYLKEYNDRELLLKREYEIAEKKSFVWVYWSKFVRRFKRKLRYQNLQRINSILFICFLLHRKF